MQTSEETTLSTLSTLSAAAASTMVTALLASTMAAMELPLSMPPQAVATMEQTATKETVVSSQQRQETRASQKLQTHTLERHSGLFPQPKNNQLQYASKLLAHTRELYPSSMRSGTQYPTAFPCFRGSEAPYSRPFRRSTACTAVKGLRKEKVLCPRRLRLRTTSRGKSRSITNRGGIH